LGSQLLATLEGSTTNYLHPDHLSTRLTTDASGNVVEQCHYPFGEFTGGASTCTIPTNYRFAGMEYDSETGLYHTWFRQYDPSQGRWTGVDPLSGSLSDPQSLTRYAYILNDPVNRTDPLGLESSGGPEPQAGCFAGFFVEMGLSIEEEERRFEFARLLNLPVSACLSTDGLLFEIASEDAGGGPASAQESSDANSREICSRLRSKFPARFEFVQSNLAVAKKVATVLETSPTFILGLSSLESDDSRSRIARTAGNYFGLTVGRQFRGTEGEPYVTADGRRFGRYPEPSFENSAWSFAGSTHGARVRGAVTAEDFARGLTTGTHRLGAFNSEMGYFSRLVNRISNIYEVLNCIDRGL
jgi:RHS repeat-associated protein